MLETVCKIESTTTMILILDGNPEHAVHACMKRGAELPFNTSAMQLNLHIKR